MLQALVGDEHGRYGVRGCIVAPHADPSIPAVGGIAVGNDDDRRARGSGILGFLGKAAVSAQEEDHECLIVECCRRRETPASILMSAARNEQGSYQANVN